MRERRSVSEALRPPARRRRPRSTRRSSARARAIPPHPEHDLLWFIAEYAPELEEWERDIFLAVREESFYFYPVFACQIMNEGWASYWHARLLREADFLPHNEYLDALKAHSDVVRPHAAEQQASLVDQSLSPRLLDLGVDRRGARPRARVPDPCRGRRLRLHPQPPHAGACRGAQAVPLRADAPTAACRCSTTTSTRCARRVLAPKYNFGAPAVLAKHVAQRRLADARSRARDRRPRPRRRSRRARARLHAQGVAPPDHARDDRRRAAAEDRHALLSKLPVVLDPIGDPQSRCQPTS